MSTKYPCAAVTLTYENAVKPIADTLYTKRVFEDGSRTCYAGGYDEVAQELQEHAEDQDTKAWALTEFVAQLFGLSRIDVRGDAYERASEMYKER